MIKKGDMVWMVKHFDMNKQEIMDYNVLAYREEQIKEFKKKIRNKADLSEALRKEMMYQYGSRAEYELVAALEGERIFLYPWCGCWNIDKAKIEVTDDDSFDWRGFAAKMFARQIWSHEAKFDIFDQLDYKWEEFVDYCWNYHHKYQRRKKND